ncbi:MAG: CDP-glycerol glycerophosphotransferase family protein [Eubacterium sp.]|uniref:CDP-glycerol glycerophosphotransferase family protein n=1 Tax=Eubacterium sp. TaxID=142586 RepID=UPI0039920650
MSSEYMKEHMLRDYMLENISQNNIMLAGYPRNSVFFEKPNEKIIKEEQLEKKQVIAYLPTWRGSLNEAVGTDEIIENLNYIDSHLNENQEFYVNLHPYLKGTVDLGKFKNIKTSPKYETYDFSIAVMF